MTSGHTALVCFTIVALFFVACPDGCPKSDRPDPPKAPSEASECLGWAYHHGHISRIASSQEARLERCLTSFERARAVQ